jgi:hypothetical protein
VEDVPGSIPAPMKLAVMPATALRSVDRYPARRPR